MGKLSKAKLTIVITCAILVVSLALAIAMYFCIPKSVKLDSPSGNFSNAIVADTGEWLYATSTGELAILSSDNEIKSTCNLIDIFKERTGITNGILRRIERPEGSNYLYGIVDGVGSEGVDNTANYLFKASLKTNAETGETEFEVLSEVEFKGNVDNAYFLETDEYFYVLATGQQMAMLKAYNASDLSEVMYNNGKKDVPLETYLYDTKEGMDGVALSTVKMAVGVNVFVADGDYIYIMYDGGFIRVAKDFSDVVYPGKTLECEVDSIDTSKYISFQFSGVNSRGGAYVEESETFYIVDQGNYMRKFKKSDIDSVQIGSTLKTKVVSTVYFEDLVKESSALTYDPKTNIGYITYQKTDKITKIDFISETVDFTFALDFNIDKIVFGLAEGEIFYIFKNRHETDSPEVTILAFTNVELKRNEPVFRIFMIIGFVLAGISATVAAVLSVIVVRKKEKDALLTLKKMARHKWIYIALVPSTVLLAMFCYYEAIASIALSFFDYTLDSPTMLWNNFANYKEVFGSSHAGEAFGNMILFLVFDIIVAIVPPLLFAFFLTILRWEKLSNAIRTMLFVSGVIPAIAGMLIWKTGIYGSDGVLNTIIEAFGGEGIQFLSNSAYTKWSVLMMGFPFVGAYLIFYGGMMNIPSSYYEAAELEGVGIWKRFFAIDLPLIVPQLKYVFITSFIHSVQNFSRTQFLTNGGAYGTYTPIQLMYTNIRNGNYGQASAYATIIFIFLFFVTFINFKTQKRDLAD